MFLLFFIKKKKKKKIGVEDAENFIFSFLSVSDIACVFA
jgi:hypothetical protein